MATRRFEAAAAAGALALAAMLAACGGSGEPGPAQDAAAASAAAEAASSQDPNLAADATAPAETPTAGIILYFADRQGRLAAETRALPWEGTPAERGRRVVQALLDGPRDGLTRVVPADTNLLAFYLGEDGTAYVDLDAAFGRGLSGGSADALIAVRSITDTLAGCLKEVERVKILVEGEEVRDLAGHLDLSRPLEPESQPR